MEIHARRVGVAGPHGPLLKPTSLRVPPGEPVLVAGPPGAGHTALGLVLSGRMRPGTGTVSPDGPELRRTVVLVDSPGVSEPEGSLALGGVVGEELALNGHRSGRKAVADWLVERGADEHLGTRFEYVPADLRCALMLELAAGRPGARVLVLDTPDRYHPDPAGWWKSACEQVTPDRSVVVLCHTASAAALDVPAARLGTDNTADNTATDDTAPDVTADSTADCTAADSTAGDHTVRAATGRTEAAEPTGTADVGEEKS